jgi:hypothetical protein
MRLPHQGADRNGAGVGLTRRTDPSHGSPEHRSVNSVNNKPTIRAAAL